VLYIIMATYGYWLIKFVISWHLSRF
jgi:hypothetical protein